MARARFAAFLSGFLLGMIMELKNHAFVVKFLDSKSTCESDDPILLPNNVSVLITSR